MPGRRVARRRVRLAGRVWNDVAQELQEVLDQILDSNDNGVPPGFYDTTPDAIAAGSTGDPGTESSGWAAADHEHPVNTATPSNPTGSAAAEGSSAYLMRSDATIKQGIVSAKGDLLVFSTVPTSLPVGTDGQVLTADSSEDEGITWADPTGGSGGGAATAIFDLVENIDVVAPATSVSFATGVDGDTDEVYALVFRMIKAVVAAITVVLKPNGVTTNQVTKGTIDGTGVGTISTATLQIVANGSGTTGDVDHGLVTIDAKTGAVRTARMNSLEAVGSSVYLIDAGMSWNETVTNITSLDVVCSVAAGIGAGSYFRLYKLRKVAPAASASDSFANTFMLMGA